MTTKSVSIRKFLPKTWGKVAGTTLWARRIPKKREGSWWCYWTKVYWGFTIPASVKCNSSVQWCDVLWSVHLPGMERRTRLAVRVPPQKLKDFLPDLIQRMQDTHGVIISPKIIVPHQDLSETTGSENEQLYIFKEYRPNSSPWGEAITISDEYIPEIF